jgi:DNA-cytosine methyltransferase
MSAQRPTLLSVFSGAGGLDLGLEAAGFRHVGLIEQDSACRQTLKINRPRWPQLKWQDVYDAATSCTPAYLNIRKGDLDLLAGASPCQPFSKAAQWVSTARLGFADKRADTLSAFLELARRFLPKAILLENVPAFWSTKFPTRHAIADFFADLQKQTGIQYRYTTAILNAADYGVPQTRRRFILVAWRTPHEFSWPKRAYLARPMTSWDALHNITPKAMPLRRGRWADLLPSIPEGKNYIWHTDRGGGMNL